jgi:diguanylate cyclase (GGDEF)-like protein
MHRELTIIIADRRRGLGRRVGSDRRAPNRGRTFVSRGHYGIRSPTVDRSVTPVLKDLSLAQQLSRVFSIFGALVAGGFCLTAFAYAASYFWVTPQFDRSRLALSAESDALAAMIDEENGLRGYLFARDPKFLAAYTRGTSGLARAHETLSENVDAELTPAMLGTRLAEERWHERWADAASDRRPEAVPPSWMDGKLLFDDYRVDEATFAALLAQRDGALRLRERRLIAARVGLELTVFAVIFFLALRQHRALRDSIVIPVAALLRHIGHVRDGQLEVTVGVDAPRELRQLGEGLNEMVGALATARESAEARDETVRSHSLQLRQILDASREFSESLNLSYVVGAVRASTAAVGGYERVIVWVMDDPRKRLVNADHGVAAASSDEPAEEVHTLAARAAKSGRITFEKPNGEIRFSDSSTGPIAAIAIPLIVGARVVGALEARHAEPTLVTVHAVEVLETLATHAATAIESARLHEVIEERSHVDALTRLLNRRRLEEDLDSECKRCSRYDRPLAFVMLDVDHFKAFNDSHGHPRADVVLQEVAEVIAGCVRTTDTAYRYGGEEFCILLRETNAQEAMHLAERVRQRLELRFASGATPGVTASFGVAEFLAATPTPRELVEAADAAMYESKHAGRNRVSMAPAFAVIVPRGETQAAAS